MIRLALVFALVVASTAVHAAPKRDRAAEADVERLEIAREHFQRGEMLEKEGALEAALIELEMAELAHPSVSVSEVKQRVRAALSARRPAPVTAVLVAPVAPLVATPRRPLRRFIAPIVIAPLALGALVVGGALLATVRSDVSRMKATCSPSCNPSDVDRLRPREGAAIGLLAAGGVLAVADAVLWGVLAGRKEQPARASLRPSLSLGPDGGAAVLSGAF